MRQIGLGVDQEELRMSRIESPILLEFDSQETGSKQQHWATEKHLDSWGVNMQPASEDAGDAYCF